MIDPSTAQLLLNPTAELKSEVLDSLESVGFEDAHRAVELLRDATVSQSQRTALQEILPGLLFALKETADPDRSVRNFHRFVHAVPDRDALFREFMTSPRCVEILAKLFVGSQFLTEILLRHPNYLDRLTHHKRLSEFKSREEFVESALTGARDCQSFGELQLHLRRYHQWEILRIAACDTFGLMDLKTVTLQLALLADAVVQVALLQLARLEGVATDQLTVLAFGKMGGLELNYSSDIDLVFVVEEVTSEPLKVGQRLVKLLSDFTAEGFLYRVDLRLRPWGNAGPLVATWQAYQDYYTRHAQIWERQALLKARPVAGDLQQAEIRLKQVKTQAFQLVAEAVRQSILKAKQDIERKTASSGDLELAVKSGPGGIRDIEFVVQFLQFVHGEEFPHIRQLGTQSGLVHLSEAELIHAEEYRTLSTAYLNLRTIEHALQLMHNQQEYFLPNSVREMDYLARRLDYSGVEQFLAQYRKHTRAVREIFLRHLGAEQNSTIELQGTTSQTVNSPSGQTPVRHNWERLIDQLSPECVVALEVIPLASHAFDVTFVGYDHLGDLATICGLLYACGYDILTGTAEMVSARTTSPRRIYVNRFRVQATHYRDQSTTLFDWQAFELELNELLRLSLNGKTRDAQKRLVRRLADAIHQQPDPTAPLLPVEISFDRESGGACTILDISGADVPGFLYELTNAIAMSGLSIERMHVQTIGSRVYDRLYVVDPAGGGRLAESQEHQLRAAVVLIKQFIHLLPHAPNPEAALLHFRGLLANLFEQTDWIEQLQTLQQPEVLTAVAKLLGYSDFLWEDFLRLQHQNLFPVVTDLAGLQDPRTREELLERFASELQSYPDRDPFDVLNDFKDRQMMRVDMRHILGVQSAFGTFSLELTAVAETIVAAATQICFDTLAAKYGIPLNAAGEPARLAVCALGKCGGRELGYASDIELMFIYDADEYTSGPDRIANLDFYTKLVEMFRRGLRSRHKRIFEIDLRLRPYGNAGSLAVSQAAFQQYFQSDGPAWPFERQALVKMRPIAGDDAFGVELIALRDQLIYTGEPFDLSSMRAMREKQIRQLVEPGTFHAKLSPGGLVDCEYFVQALQLTYGHLSSDVREPNTRTAMKGLEKLGVLSSEQRLKLRDAYRFLRRLIDAMRMVRGDATDLTIPSYGTEQFEFLAKRINIPSENLHQEIERQTCQVINLIMVIEELLTARTLKKIDSGSTE